MWEGGGGDGRSATGIALHVCGFPVHTDIEHSFVFVFWFGKGRLPFSSISTMKCIEGCSYLRNGKINCLLCGKILYHVHGTKLLYKCCKLN